MRDRTTNQNDTNGVTRGVESTVAGLQGPARAAEIFADPIGYLANLGITAEVVDVVDASPALPAAA